MAKKEIKEDEFKDYYIGRLREVSPGQPTRWYMHQANQQWINIQKQIKNKSNGK